MFSEVVTFIFTSDRMPGIDRQMMQSPVYVRWFDVFDGDFDLF